MALFSPKVLHCSDMCKKYFINGHWGGGKELANGFGGVGGFLGRGVLGGGGGGGGGGCLRVLYYLLTDLLLGLF